MHNVFIRRKYDLIVHIDYFFIVLKCHIPTTGVLAKYANNCTFDQFTIMVFTLLVYLKSYINRSWTCVTFTDNPWKRHQR